MPPKFFSLLYFSLLNLGKDKLFGRQGTQRMIEKFLAEAQRTQEKGIG